MTEEGHLHPLSHVVRDIEMIFAELGFSYVDGPEFETEYYNFDALNMPSDHSSRDMQDTFWVKQRNEKNERQLLRTQTSSVQIRAMEKLKPPFRVVVTGGRVFRNEATDATHEAQFYQQEALYVDKNVNLAQLKGTLSYFCRRFFGEESAEIRFRPSYFPFVEPALEVDMRYKGKWLEIAGSGLVHPNVLRNVGIDPSEWQGFAFSFGIDRLAILRHGIDDIRLFYNGDLRLVQQF
ncbi:phenylalanine--tRNA ligase subunit alpha [Candidatus Kaiserbacteria bacterium]|nr:phenylalanine--tRNA ligase subunit alpha [Candidatus Kaiserbacteria bacterium]